MINIRGEWRAETETQHSFGAILQELRDHLTLPVLGEVETLELVLNSLDTGLVLALHLYQLGLAATDRRVTVGVRDDVHDGPAGHGGGDVPHHLGDLLPLGVAMLVVEEDTGTANTIV